jgi:hypothetical protein
MGNLQVPREYAISCLKRTTKLFSRKLTVGISTRMGIWLHKCRWVKCSACQNSSSCFCAQHLHSNLLIHFFRCRLISSELVRDSQLALIGKVGLATWYTNLTRSFRLACQFNTPIWTLRVRLACHVNPPFLLVLLSGNYQCRWVKVWCNWPSCTTYIHKYYASLLWVNFLWCAWRSSKSTEKRLLAM